MNWISVKDKKPTEKDSPILALDSLDHFSISALIYEDGWNGLGWYEANGEFGMGLEIDEAFYQEYQGMLFWMTLPDPPCTLEPICVVGGDTSLKVANVKHPQCVCIECY